MARTAIILGASGLVGNELLQLLLTDSHFERVKVFVRKKLDITHEKLEQYVINFDSVAKYKEEINGDVCFCCIGTTIKVAGSKDAFIQVDYTYPVEFAKVAQANGVKSFLFISSTGADKNSSNFYLKVKGDTEYALQELNFETLHILRPSLLLGKRKELRAGEILAKIVMRLFSFIFIGGLKKYKPITARTVAKAMLILSKEHSKKAGKAPKPGIFLSDELQKLGQ